MLAACVAALVGGLASRAAAQEAMIEYVGVGTPLFVEADLREMTKIYGLSPEQQTAAEALLKSAVRQAQVIYQRLMGKSPWDAMADDEPETTSTDPEEQAKARTKMFADWQKLNIRTAREAAALEREALRDVQSLLTSEQAAKGWSEFDRFRRRELVMSQGWYWFGSDPASALKSAKVSEPDLIKAAPFLEKLDRAVDELLIQRLATLRQLNDEAIKTGEYDAGAWQKPGLKTEEIRRLNVRTFGEIEGVVSEGAAQAIRKQRIGFELFGYFPPPEQHPKIARVLAVQGLDDPGRAHLQARIDEAREGFLTMAVAALKLHDQLVLSGEEQTVIAQRLLDSRKAYTNRIESLAKDLRGELSEQQRQLLDEPVVPEESVDAMFKQQRRSMPASPWLPQSGPGADR